VNRGQQRQKQRWEAQHEETEVVGVDGSGAINHLTDLVVDVERLPM
jgi:hypothetical protein